MPVHRGIDPGCDRELPTPCAVYATKCEAVLTRRGIDAANCEDGPGQTGVDPGPHQDDAGRSGDGAGRSQVDAGRSRVDVTADQVAPSKIESHFGQ
jgi:hypothetical protein